MFKKLKFSIASAAIITLIFGTIYASVQQDYRQNAYDPQIQIAEDAAAQLAAGRVYNLSNDKIDIEKSLAPYIIIFNSKNEPTASLATLNGKTPIPPAGVFDYTLKHDEDRITWEPKPGVRQAIIVRSFAGTNSGFILIGRSMREVEKRIHSMAWAVLAGWLGSLVIAMLAIWSNFLMIYYHKRRHQPDAATVESIVSELTKEQ